MSTRNTKYIYIYSPIGILRYFKSSAPFLHKAALIKSWFILLMLFISNVISLTPPLQEHNLDWFPRMRAMSLVSSDGEGEQNELRSLQEKLESTMRLVSNLTNQLTELKEQVSV